MKNRPRDLARLARTIVNLTDLNLLFVDTEVTDLNGEVIELGIVDAEGNVLWGPPATRGLICPQGEISAGAEAVHGISAEMVKDAPTWPQVYPVIKRILEGQQIMAYNAKFDRARLLHTCMIYQLPPIMATWHDIMVPYATFYGEWNDYRSSYKWQKLTAACRQCGIMLDGAHRAVNDAEATRRLFEYMAGQVGIPEVATDSAEVIEAAYGHDDMPF